MDLTIKKLEEMPPVKPNKTTSKNDFKLLLDKFDKGSWKYAEIPVTKEHSARGIRISIGRIIKNKKTPRPEIETYESLDGKSVIIKRK